MSHLLQNKNIELGLDLPQEGYQGTRFDWTGKITSLTYKGRFLTTTEKQDEQDQVFDGQGFYNEFGIEYPLGHERVGIGDWFAKIGVGLLQKKAADYHFQNKYNVRPSEFEVRTGTDHIRIICNSPPTNGHAYRLTKEIKLKTCGFVINYQLENTGREFIITNEYNHNFLSIDRTAIGKHYELRFPFRLQPKLFGEYVDPEQLVEIGEQRIAFNKAPQHPFFFSNLSGGVLVDAQWDLVNTESGLGISETGDFKTNAINIWGCGHVICPELFHQIYLPAGQTTRWTRTYRVYELS